MKSVEQILAVLESLSRADRQWIVERLPDNAKSLLMNELSNSTVNSSTALGTIANSSNSIENDSSMTAGEYAQINIEQIAPGVAANILASEPIWIIVAILQSAHSTWVMKVSQALPTSIRSMVTVMRHDSRVMPAPVVVSLRNTLLRHSAMNSTAFTPIEITPRWRQWVDAIWSRSVA